MRDDEFVKDNRRSPTYVLVEGRDDDSIQVARKLGLKYVVVADGGEGFWTPKGEYFDRLSGDVIARKYDLDVLCLEGADVEWIVEEGGDGERFKHLKGGDKYGTNPQE